MPWSRWGRVVWVLGLASASYVGCSDRDMSNWPSHRCVTDADCADNDHSDPCFSPWWCEQYNCTQVFLPDETSCQCQGPGDCEDLGFEKGDCSSLECDSQHQCSEQLSAAGPAPAHEQIRGDCQQLVCDGSSIHGTIEPDAEDIPDDHDECTVDSCGDEGPLNEPLSEGDICTDGEGICYSGDCHDGCVPSDPADCGDEGPSEPQNDVGTGATLYSQSGTACGMLDGTDIDWYETYLVDEDFEYDVLEMGVLSTASHVELCAYVLCHSGFPEGGCANKLQGPSGSHGCCWEGSPEALQPSWDLDCSDTSDDAGTLFFSVRAPGGDDCDTYVVWAHY